MEEKNRLCIKRAYCTDDCMICTKAVKVELISEIVNGKVVTRPNGIYGCITMGTSVALKNQKKS